MGHGEESEESEEEHDAFRMMISGFYWYTAGGQSPRCSSR
jgi:hypothetical protein